MMDQEGPTSDQARPLAFFGKINRWPLVRVVFGSTLMVVLMAGNPNVQRKPPCPRRKGAQ